MRFTLLILGAIFCLNAGADIAMSSKSDELLVAEAEKLVREEGLAANATPATIGSSPVALTTVADAASTAAAADTKDLKESEIPVFIEAKKTVKSESNLVWRLVGSLAFIGAIAIGMVFAGKRWTAKKNTGGEKSRIEVLHQVHFGPKKTLCLVRVAGEVILLGMTEQSVSMLKSVVLIDDELENTMNADFNKFLNDEFAVEDIRSAISSRA
jgi:flagellar biogenesis protein FliO